MAKRKDASLANPGIAISVSRNRLRVGIKILSCIMPIPESWDLRPYKQNIRQVAEVKHANSTPLLIRNVIKGNSNGF